MTENIKDLFYRNGKVSDNDESGSSSDLNDVYNSRLKGPQEIGWFVSDVMLKLGLLGTIIGFIFMLGSVANIADFDVSNMQKILRHMSNGMGTALWNDPENKKILNMEETIRQTDFFSFFPFKKTKAVLL